MVVTLMHWSFVALGHRSDPIHSEAKYLYFDLSASIRRHICCCVLSLSIWVRGKPSVPTHFGFFNPHRHCCLNVGMSLRINAPRDSHVVAFLPRMRPASTMMATHRMPPTSSGLCSLRSSMTRPPTSSWLPSSKACQTEEQPDEALSKAAWRPLTTHSASRWWGSTRGDGEREGGSWAH
jgi:hypothetical protein